MSADEKPGPSSGVTVTEEELAQAEKDFKEAVKLVYDEPERAAMLLGKVTIFILCGCTSMLGLVADIFV